MTRTDKSYSQSAVVRGKHQLQKQICLLPTARLSYEFSVSRFRCKPLEQCYQYCQMPMTDTKNAFLHYPSHQKIPVKWDVKNMFMEKRDILGTSQAAPLGSYVKIKISKQTYPSQLKDQKNWFYQKNWLYLRNFCP